MELIEQTTNGDSGGSYVTKNVSCVLLGLRRHIVCFVVINVSEERIASIFRVKGEGIVFLPEYMMTSQPRRPQQRYICFLDV